MTESLKPVHLLYGAETYLIEEEIANLVAKMHPEMPELNIGFFRFQDTPVQAVVREASTLPFMANRRVIVYRGLELVTSVKGTSKVDHDPQVLEEYLEQPVLETVLICTAPAEKLDVRKRLTKLFQKHARVVRFDTLKPNEAVGWIIKRANAMGLKITPQVAMSLYGFGGSSLHSVVSELDKISLYLNGQGEITQDIVDALVVRTLEDNIFQFIECVMRRRYSEAYQQLGDLLLLREAPLKLLTLLARQCRIVLHSKTQAERGTSQSEVAAQLGVHPFAVKMAVEQAALYSKRQLEQMMMDLADLDFAIKSGQVSDTEGLRMWLLRLAAKGA